MQISTNLMFERAASRMSTLMAVANKQNTQIATTKKYSSPSENASVAQQIAEFDRKDANAAAYSSNMDLSSSLLKQADTTLSSMTEQLQRATALATQAGNDTLNASDRAVIGKELQSIVSSLVELGNVNDSSGRSLFGGETGKAAIVDNGDGTFTYNTAPRLSDVPIGDNMTIQPTETASRIFTEGAGGDILKKLTELAAALQTTDPDKPGGTVARESLESLKQASDQMSIVQASVGARAARVELQQTLQQSARTDRAELRSSMEDTDIAQTSAEYAKTLLVLNATQASFAKLSQLSLFTYLR